MLGKHEDQADGSQAGMALTLWLSWSWDVAKNKTTQNNKKTHLRNEKFVVERIKI